MTTNDEQEQRATEIRERVEKATAGPWNALQCDSGEWWEDAEVWADGDELANVRFHKPVYEQVGDTKLLSNIVVEQAHANADFIAHSRADVPWLLQQLDSARAREAALRSALDNACEWFDDDACRSFREPLWYAEARLALISSGTGRGRP